jgi:hypothetical protein
MHDEAAKSLQEVIGRFIQMLEGRSVGAFKTRLGIVVHNFEVGKSVLRPEHKDYLAVFAHLYLSQPDMDITIEEVVGGASRTGGEARNLALSVARAQAVQDALTRLGFPHNYPVLGHGYRMLPLKAADEDPIHRNVAIRFSLNHRRAWENVQRAAPVTDWLLDLKWGANASGLDRGLRRIGIRNPSSFVQAIWKALATVENHDNLTVGRGVGLQVAGGTLTKRNALGENVTRDVQAMIGGLEWGLGLDVAIPGIPVSGAYSYSLGSTDGFFQTDTPVDFPDFDGRWFFIGSLAGNLTAFSANATSLVMEVGGWVAIPLGGIDVVMGMDFLKAGATLGGGFLFVLDP